MSDTSVTINEHFEGLISKLIASGRYTSASEVIDAGLRRLEEDEEIRLALIKGEESGISKRKISDIVQDAKAHING